MTTKIAISVALAFVALASVAGVVLYIAGRLSPPASDGPVRETAHQPTLYCDFYDFMHASVVVSFDFAVSADRGAPRFAERAEVDADRTRTAYDGEDPPMWSYAVDEGTPTIAAPDGATRIVLYGLKPKAPGVFWTEAGIRSNTYRNLEGKCRQAYFNALAG